MEDEGNHYFQQTQWSMIVGAAKSEDGAQLRHLSELCSRYWRPVYYFIRSQGFSAHDAEDLTQEFLSEVTKGKILKVADPLRGRFRSFLLKCCKNFLINARARARALKRGGGVVIVSLQSTMEEGSEYQPPDPNVMTPDELFDRQWALALLKRVLDRLGETYQEDGKEKLFEALRHTLTGDEGGEGYAEIGRQLEMSEANVKVAVYRMRRKYRELIRAEISATVCTEREVDEEIRFLADALR